VKSSDARSAKVYTIAAMQARIARKHQTWHLTAGVSVAVAGLLMLLTLLVPEYAHWRGVAGLTATLLGAMYLAFQEARPHFTYWRHNLEPPTGEYARFELSRKPWIMRVFIRTLARLGSPPSAESLMSPPELVWTKLLGFSAIAVGTLVQIIVACP
jgi:hypothetical protein